MDYFIDNHVRKCVGLNLILDSWDLKIITKGEYCKYYLFFDGDTIKKVIQLFLSPEALDFLEFDTYYLTTENRSIVLPRTNKGRERKLTGSVIDSFDCIGNYLTVYSLSENEETTFLIGNRTIQRTFYEKKYSFKTYSIDGAKKICQLYADSCTDEDINEAISFRKLKRKCVRYREGDYFRVKLDKNLYTYGRIIYDIRKRQKAGYQYWDVLMGNPLIIEMFHVLSDDKNMSVVDLKKLKTFPSQHIFDNNLFYGDYEIIGYDSDLKDARYPIMYGKSISTFEPCKIVFQCGCIYKEIPFDGSNLVEKNKGNSKIDFTNRTIGFSINVNTDILDVCIKDNSNDEYWNYYRGGEFDLRAPQNRGYLLQVLKQFDLVELYDLYKNY